MFVKRLLSGIVVLAVTGVAFALGGVFLNAILLIISLIGYAELVKALCAETERRPLNGPDTIAYISIILYYGAVTVTDDHTFLILVIGGFMLMFFVFAVLREMIKFISRSIRHSRSSNRKSGNRSGR